MGNRSSIVGIDDEFPSLEDRAYGSSALGFDDEPRCHHSIKQVFKVGDMAVCAAAERLIKLESIEEPKAVLLNCLGSALRQFRSPRVKAPKGWESLEDTAPTFPEIVIDWTDYSSPPVGPEFWAKLIEVCKKKEIKQMVVFCMGSHGRTGTALAALLLANRDYTDPDEAIEFVRENHCRKSVESSSQIDYLIKCAGQKKNRNRQRADTNPLAHGRKRNQRQPRRPKKE